MIHGLCFDKVVFFLNKIIIFILIYVKLNFFYFLYVINKTQKNTRIVPIPDVTVMVSLKNISPDIYIHGTVNVINMLAIFELVYLKPMVIIKLPKKPIKEMISKPNIMELVKSGKGSVILGINSISDERL